MLMGLTGGYCSGKNFVAALLERRGWAAIDVDRLGHRALELSRDEVVRRFDGEARARFGRGLLDEGGALDRKMLGAIVFADPAALADHESIVHPAMFALVDDEIGVLREAAHERGDAEARIVVNAAILYKMALVRACDILVEVRAPLLLRLRRAKRRDGLGARRALDRIGSQAALWRLRPRGNPNFFPLRNAGDEARLQRKLDAILARLRK